MNHKYVEMVREFEVIMDIPKSKQLFVQFLKKHNKDHLLDFIEQVDRLALLRCFSNQKKKAKEIISQFMPYLVQGNQFQTSEKSSPIKSNKKYVQIPKELQVTLVQSVRNLKESITRTNEVTECFQQVRDFVHMKLLTIWFPIFRMTNIYQQVQLPTQSSSTSVTDQSANSYSNSLTTFFKSQFFDQDIQITKEDFSFVASQLENTHHHVSVIQNWDNIALLLKPESNIEINPPHCQEQPISLTCFQIVALMNTHCTSALEALLQYSNTTLFHSKVKHEMIDSQSCSPSNEKFSQSLHRRECKMNFPHSKRVFQYGQACTFDAVNKKYYVVLKSGNVVDQGQVTKSVQNSFLYEGYCLEQINPYQTKITHIGWITIGKNVKKYTLNSFLTKQVKLFVDYMLQYPTSTKLQDTILMELFQQNLVQSKSFVGAPGSTESKYTKTEELSEKKISKEQSSVEIVVI